MKALVIIAHGSRLQTSNHEIRTRVEAVATTMQDQFDLIETGFLEFAKPDIAGAIEQCVLAGASEISVYPFFLAAGKHVETDIPNVIRQAGRQHDSVKINQLQYLGSTAAMTDFICQHIRNQN